MEAILLVIIYLVFSSVLNSQKAKKNRANRPKVDEPALPPMTERAPKRAAQEQMPRKTKKRGEGLFELPTSDKSRSAKPAAAKKKKTAPNTVSMESERGGRKAPLTPIKKDEHQHEHKKAVESRLSKRPVHQAPSYKKRQTQELQVQVLAEGGQSTSAPSFKLKTDQQSMIEGIIWSEVLAKPRALRK